MGLLDSLFAGGAGTLVKAVGDVADNLFTSDEERAAGELAQYQAETERIRVEQGGAQAQIQVNMTEAQHASIFVAGWRPFIGWICGYGLVYHFGLYPLILWGLATVKALWEIDIEPPPDLAWQELATLLGGLLGLGSLRTYERMKGVARGRLRPPRRG